jgi:hypothetical protein
MHLCSERLTVLGYLSLAFSLFAAFYYVEGNSVSSWIARLIVFALLMGWALWHWRRFKRQHG